MAHRFSTPSTPSLLRAGLGALALTLSLVGCGPVDEDPSAAAVEGADVGTQAQALLFKPDLRVNFLSATSLGTVPASYNVKFRITNIGIGGAYNGTLHTVVSSRNGNLGRSESYHQVLPSLETDQYTDVTYRCPTLNSTQQGYACTGVTVTANVADELDPSNNTRSWQP